MLTIALVLKRDETKLKSCWIKRIQKKTKIKLLRGVVISGII
jgi:hypothetical protein